MNSLQSIADERELTTLSFKTLFSLSVGAGVSVASIYYNQPILDLLAKSFRLDVSQAGLIPTLTQIGYALGILLLVPLGDSLDRKKLIIAKASLLAISLVVASMASGYGMLLITSLLIGVMATTAQDIVPAAAAMASDQQRGKTVGTVMTGLLTGILLSRVFSGFIAEFFGWQSVFYSAALAVAVTGLLLSRILPAMPVSSALTYKQTLQSMLPLWQRYPRLKQAALSQGLMSLSFSAFWTTLAVFLADKYQMGSAAAGAFGIAGAAGAIAAPLAGSLSDKIGAHKVAVTSILLVVFSYVGIYFTSLLPLAGQIPALIALVIVFDFGLNATLIAHQSIVYGLEPQARGRLNAILFTFVFIGMASGSALGSFLYQHFGWDGVVGAITAASALAWLVRLKQFREPVSG